MGWRGTAILALLIAATGLYVWSEGSVPEDPHAGLIGAARAPTEPIRHLFSFTPSQVVSIRLERPGEGARSVARMQSGWQGSSNPRTIDDFLESLTELGVLMDIPAADLKEYGLQPPRGTLTLRFKATPAPLVVHLGDHNPATTGVYVQIGNDGPVVLAGALAAWEFENTFKALPDNAEPGK